MEHYTKRREESCAQLGETISRNKFIIELQVPWAKIVKFNEANANPRGVFPN